MKQRKKVVTRSVPIDLRKWCVEKAMGWPTIRTDEQIGYPSGIVCVGDFGGGSGTRTTYRDADVLDRAEKLLAWMLK